MGLLLGRPLKVLIALVLFTVSGVASAVQVTLLTHNQTNLGGTVFTLITNGSHISGIAPPSTAVWDWDGSTLTGTGFYGATLSIGAGGGPFGSAIISDQIVNLLINTGTGTASATGGGSYICVEGTFLAQLGANGCGGYNFGANFMNDSTTVWGPGTAVSQTLGGDDVLTDGPRSISAYNFGLDGIVGVNGLNPGDQILIGNGIPVGTPGGEAMTFQVVPVPAAFWLFGSALGLLGWRIPGVKPIATNLA